MVVSCLPDRKKKCTIIATSNGVFAVRCDFQQLCARTSNHQLLPRMTTSTVPGALMLATHALLFGAQCCCLYLLLITLKNYSTKAATFYRFFVESKQRGEIRRNIRDHSSGCVLLCGHHQRLMIDMFAVCDDIAFANSVRVPRSPWKMLPTAAAVEH